VVSSSFPGVRLLAAVAIAFVVGCSGVPSLAGEGLLCQSDQDCSESLRCVQDAPTSTCPAGAACGGARCESRCRAPCDQGSDCPQPDSCERRFALTEQSPDCDVIVGAYVRACVPAEANPTADGD
jgi:hypothetical protein